MSTKDRREARRLRKQQGASIVEGARVIDLQVRSDAMWPPRTYR
jgi:hypothetical protein